MSSRSPRPTGRKIGVAALAASLGLAGLGLAAAPAQAVPGFAFERLAGEDRIETAVAISTDTFASSTTALIARADKFPDALAGNYLAGAEGAPILLSHTDEVPQDTLDELARLGVTDVTLLGGTAALSDDVAAALEAEGYTVGREAGADRYETAADIATSQDAATIGDTADGRTAILATGEKFPDALAGGPLAYAGSHPLLLTPTAALGDDASGALETLGIEHVLILGGSAAVSDTVEAELTAMGMTSERLAGGFRWETATAIAEYALANAGFSAEHVNVATGMKFPDALTGGPHAGDELAPILLADDSNTSFAVSYLEAHADTLVDGHIYGGVLAVSQAVEDTLTAAAQGDGPTTNQSFAATPTEAAENTASTTGTGTATDNRGARQYTVDTGDATSVRIELIPCDEVAVDENGTVTFGDNEGTANQADDLGNTGARIETVNGVATTGDDSQTATPVNGSVSFTIDSENANICVIPVVYEDTDNDGELDLTVPTSANANPKEPSERFGIGGAKSWIPAEAGAGTLGAADADDEEVLAVDKDLDRFITADGTYFYDANDRFFISNALGAGVESCDDPADQVTLTQFEAELSVGDELDFASFYQPATELPSTFCLEDIAPGAPTVTATGDQGNVDLDITPPAGFDADDTITVQRATVDDGVDNICGGAGAADDAIGAYATVATLTRASDEVPATPAVIDYTDTVAPGCYSYRTVATVDGETSANSTPVTAESTADVTAPTMASATPNDVNDGTGTTNQVVVTFSESVTILDVSRITVHPAGQPGLIFTVTGASPANANNTAYVLTLSGSLNDAAVDVTYQVDSAAGAYEDTSGNDNVAEDPDTTFAY